MSDNPDEGVSEKELDEFLAKGDKYDVAYLRGLSTRELQRKVLGHLKKITPGIRQIQDEIAASRHVTPEDLQSRCNVTSIY